MSGKPEKKAIHWPGVMDALLIYGGALIIVAQVMWLAANPFDSTLTVKRLQVVVVGLGLVLNQIGLWHVASHFISGRKYLGLRDEVDRFIRLVRDLNRHHLTGNEPASEDVKKEMHASVERMAKLAGREGA